MAQKELSNKMKDKIVKTYILDKLKEIKLGQKLYREENDRVMLFLDTLINFIENRENKFYNLYFVLKYTHKREKQLYTYKFDFRELKREDKDTHLEFFDMIVPKIQELKSYQIIERSVLKGEVWE